MNAPSTADRLADRLRDMGLMEMSDRARKGEFDDYRSEHAMPQHVLIKALLEIGVAKIKMSVPCKELIDEVKEGKFDSTKEESDAWAASPEGQQAMKDLMHGEL